MGNADTPDDGDFSRFIEQKQKEASSLVLNVLAAGHPRFGLAPFDAPDPGTESPEEIAALHDAPPLSDAELEQQALANGRADDFVDDAPEPEEATAATTDDSIEAEPLAFDLPTFGTAVLEVAPLSEAAEEEIAALRDAPLSDEELELQALATRAIDEDSGAR